MATVETARLDELRAAFGGTLLEPSDPGYDEARRVHNAMIDRRPALIAQCRNTADIVDAVHFARKEGLEICVRGGGHNVAGRAVIDGALMIDLSPMRGIHVDRDAMTLRAQGGCLWAELNREAALHGLATTGGAISHTGVSGLTLGGGLGWLMAKHGLAADNVIAVELVTAEGRVLDVTADSDPDLFWALRGGGGNYGIAASIKFRLHPMPTVTGGLIAHPIEKAGEMLRFYRDVAPTVSEDLTVFAGLFHAPDGSGMKLAGLVVFHTGTPEEAEQELARFTEWGPPIMAEVGPVPYPVFNTILDDAYPHGLRNYWLSAFTNGIPDGLIDTMVERFEQVTSPMSGIVLEQFHGAVTRVGPAETAVPHRDEGYSLLISSVWDDAAADEANIAWTKGTFAAMTEFFTGGRWLNYLTDDQGEDAIRGAYGANYERLGELKRRYDPENVFRANHNITP
jgi:FAD/FMN-containing dehydrogenase